MRAWTLMLPVVLAASCTGNKPADNVTPVARLQVPALGDARQPQRIDASASNDPDGAITTYRYTFGDGTPQVTRPDSFVEHVFVGAGRFEVLVEVTDDKGATSTVSRFMTLVDTFTPPYCQGNTDCESAQTCSVDAGVCFEGP